MDEQAKRSALRMIPHGVYVLTTCAGEEVAGGTVTWVTQTSFKPPLVALGLKADSRAHACIKTSKHFVLNILGSGQAAIATSFFKGVEIKDGLLGTEPYTLTSRGIPILVNAAAHLELELSGILELGDHSTVVGEVVEARLHREIEGRPDEAVLALRELGEKIFYGG